MRIILAALVLLAAQPAKSDDVYFMIDEFTDLCISRGIEIAHLRDVAKERGWAVVRDYPADPEQQFGPDMEWLVPWFGSVQNVNIKASSRMYDGEVKFSCTVSFSPQEPYSPGQFDAAFIKKMKVLVVAEKWLQNNEEMYQLVLDGPWQRTVTVTYPSKGAGPVTISALATILVTDKWWEK
jgi:hypothetical protein